MNKGSSASIGSHGQSVVTISAASWYQRSREGFMSTAAPVRLTTTTQSTPPAFGDGGIDIGLQRHLLAAAQALVCRDDDLALAVGDALSEAVGEKPANTTEWMAPIRAQASMA